jgi:hypothetical protein
LSIVTLTWPFYESQDIFPDTIRQVFSADFGNQNARDIVVNGRLHINHDVSVSGWRSLLDNNIANLKMFCIHVYLFS